MQLLLAAIIGIISVFDKAMTIAERNQQAPVQPFYPKPAPLPDWRPQCTPADIQAAEDQATDRIDDEYDYALYRMRQLVDDAGDCRG